MQYLDYSVYISFIVQCTLSSFQEGYVSACIANVELCGYPELTSDPHPMAPTIHGMYLGLNACRMKLLDLFCVCFLCFHELCKTKQEVENIVQSSNCTSLLIT